MANVPAPDAPEKLRELKAEEIRLMRDDVQKHGQTVAGGEGAEAAGAFGKYATAVALEFGLPPSASKSLQAGTIPAPPGTYDPDELAAKLDAEARARESLQMAEAGFVPKGSAAAKTQSASDKYQTALAEERYES